MHKNEAQVCLTRMLVLFPDEEAIFVLLTRLVVIIFVYLEDIIRILKQTECFTSISLLGLTVILYRLQLVS